MTEKKYKLTEEHRAQLKPWADRWIANAMSTEPMDDTDREACREAVEGIYRAANLKPPRVVFVPSPFVLRFAGGFAAAIQWARKNATRVAVTTATRDAIGAATRVAVTTATRAAIGVATRVAVTTATRDAIEAATEDATRDATGVATRVATRVAARVATGVAVGVATWNATEDATRDATRDATEDTTRAAIGSATRDAIGAATEVAARDAIGAATEGATWNATRAATLDATRVAVATATDDATRDAARVATRAVTLDAAIGAAIGAAEGATRAATRAAVGVATRVAVTTATRDAIEAATTAATGVATLDAATRDATRVAVATATDDATRDAARVATRAATEDATDDEAWYRVPISGMAAVARSIFGGDASFGLMCATEAWRMWQGGNQWSGGAAYISFFRHVAKLPIDYTRWAHWEILSERSGPRIVHPDFCMISDRPEVLLVDEQNRPHCDDGPFCRWRDGSALYAIHGVRVPWWIVENPERITVEKIDAESNSEVRRVMIDRYRRGEETSGAAAYLRDAGGEVLDRDEKRGTLWRREVPDEVPIVMLEVSNSTAEPDGSRKRYWLRVPDNIRTAQQAAAWTFAVENYNPIIET